MLRAVAEPSLTVGLVPRFSDRTILKEMSAEDQLLSRSDETTTTDRRESRPDSERRRGDFLQWRDRQIEGSSRQQTAPAPSAT